jgi:hypothetical protein
MALRTSVVHATIICSALLILIIVIIVSSSTPRKEHFSGRIRKLSLEELDGIPYVDENGETIDHMSLERSEQLVAYEHISRAACVLELGGRYGTVSCVINNVLDDPYAHVVVEPDHSVIPALIANRDTHNAFFVVRTEVISNKQKRLRQAGYGTQFLDVEEQEFAEEPLGHITMSELMQSTGLIFDTIVADCEGCLQEFIEENSDFVRGINMFIFEKDYPETTDYAYIESILLEFGLVCVVDGFHAVWKRNDHST